jgi:DNA-binding MarR family transcriptional regulator
MTSVAAQYFELLVRHETTLWNMIESRLSRAGALSLGRLKALELVASTDLCRIQEIAVGLDITVGAASRLVDRLESDGLVSRRPHPTDRRGSLIEVADAGASAITATQPIVEEILRELLAGVETAALSDLTALLLGVEQATRSAHDGAI